MTSAPLVRFFDRTTPPHISTLILIAGLAALNMSVFLPSLSGMADYFAVDYAVMQLAVSLYLATTAVLQLVIGPLSDRFGRRPVMVGAILIFLVATLGCLFAPTAVTFLAFRMVQGAIVTGIVLARAIVRDMVPADQAASMLGYVTMGMALIPMIGPVLGGVLDQFYGWQAVYVFLFLAGCVVLVQVIADQGETVSGTGIGFREQARTWPELLASQRFWGYTATMAFASGAFFAFLGGSSFVAEDIFGLSSLGTGIALGAPAIGYVIGNGLSGRYSTKVGVNRMVLAGTGIASAGMGTSLLLALIGVNSAVAFFAFCTTLGLGNGMTLPNATAGQLSVRPHLAGTASGLGGAIMIGGGAVLSALAGVMLSTETGPLPLQALMFAVSVLSMVSILSVIRREKRLGLGT
ncbi:multidrug effflux MFS transporter [Pelagovum pacificum]|uniref:Bcr/CflA family efflux transporter n=1 Tax=Pelagovum pacificum TaxID=2588711 RepID=A0A5C5GCZ6_9RHOB|nr:multidrug effflux MFS transporter [Pelagovum pacificum]QQA41327.1 multidrug effflux MFS transporter [Pelagovum pacificum]TNY31867.1 multidrug effflux MFS transporter [Pelagovum pacificum]